MLKLLSMFVIFIYLFIDLWINLFYACRAETLAVEIKEFQGQLADYNMVFAFFVAYFHCFLPEYILKYII